MIVKFRGKYGVQCNQCKEIASLQDEIYLARFVAEKMGWHQPDPETAKWETNDMCKKCTEDGY